MPVKFTSIAALAGIAEQLPECRLRVYQVIRDWDPARDGEGPSIEDIARRIPGMKESSVCGRINELKTAGAIEVGPFKTNVSGHQALSYIALDYRPYSPPAPAVQTDLFGGTLRQGVSPYATRA